MSGEPLNSIILEPEILIDAYTELSLNSRTVKTVKKSKIIVVVLCIFLANLQNHIKKTNFIIIKNYHKV